MDSMNGWVVGLGSTIYNTSDGGNSWLTQESPFLGYNKVCFTDQNNGWAVGWSGIINTTDGGDNWQIQLDCSYYSPLYDIHFINPDTGWAVGKTDGVPTQNPIIIWTHDGGNNWESEDFFGDAGLNGVYFIDTIKGWVVGDRGIIKHSPASSNTWESQSGINTYVPLYDVYFIDQNHGWAVGFAGAPVGGCHYMYTHDGGDNWEELSYVAELGRPRSIFFSDINNGWVAGQGGYPLEGRIIHTSDGGTTWELQFNLLNNTLYDIYFIDQNNGWAVGENGTVFHFNGTVWSEQSSNSSTDLKSVYFIDASNGWSIGNEGIILHTSDGGINWATQTSGTTIDLKDVMFIDSYNGWIAGGYSIYSIGTEAIILHTNNGGATWETQLADTSFQLTGIAFTDAQTGWAVGSGLIYRTTNGGDIWEVQNSGIDHYGSSIHFINNNIGWIAGGCGNILHTDNGGNTQIPKSQKPMAKDCLHIYPNPFSNQTTIEFTLSNTDFVTISIYEITGKRLKTILSKKLSKGNHKINWNAEGLNEGIYFIRLETKDISIVHKAVIMK